MPRPCLCICGGVRRSRGVSHFIRGQGHISKRLYMWDDRHRSLVIDQHFEHTHKARKITFCLKQQNWRYFKRSLHLLQISTSFPCKFATSKFNWNFYYYNVNVQLSSAKNKREISFTNECLHRLWNLLPISIRHKRQVSKRLLCINNRVWWNRS